MNVKDNRADTEALYQRGLFYLISCTPALHRMKIIALDVLLPKHKSWDKGQMGLT